MEENNISLTSISIPCSLPSLQVKQQLFHLWQFLWVDERTGGHHLLSQTGYVSTATQVLYIDTEGTCTYIGVYYNSVHLHFDAFLAVCDHRFPILADDLRLHRIVHHYGFATWVNIQSVVDSATACGQISYIVFQ